MAAFSEKLKYQRRFFLSSDPNKYATLVQKKEQRTRCPCFGLVIWRKGKWARLSLLMSLRIGPSDATLFYLLLPFDTQLVFIQNSISRSNTSHRTQRESNNQTKDYGPIVVTRRLISR